jgi:hypothetical protein
MLNRYRRTTVPITPTRPGVHIEEIPGGVHTVTGMAASITAFGWTQRELVDDPVHIFSPAEFDVAFATQPLTCLVPQQVHYDAERRLTIGLKRDTHWLSPRSYPVSGASDRPSTPKLRG